MISKKPWVSVILRVLFDTAQFMVWYRYYPLQVTVCTGSGMVWEKPTRGLPILNPRCDVAGGCNLVAREGGGRGGNWGQKPKNWAVGAWFWPMKCRWAGFWVVGTCVWHCGCSHCVAAANAAAATCWFHSHHCSPTFIHVPSCSHSLSCAFPGTPSPPLFILLCAAGAHCLYLHQIQS